MAGAAVFSAGTPSNTYWRPNYVKIFFQGSQLATPANLLNLQLGTGVETRQNGRVAPARHKIEAGFLHLQPAG
jgi:hypothetical protein